MCSFVLVLCGPPSIPAESVLPMGAGSILLGQPTVEIEVYTPDDPSTTNVNERVSYGPELVLEVLPHSFLLDTGANSVLIARDPYADSLGESNLEQMKAKGFADAVGQYREQGVGGFRDYNVSAPYTLDARSPDGSLVSLADAHLMSNDSETLADFAGIVGMPAMVGRVLALDMTPWLTVEYAFMVTGILEEVPSPIGPRYSVPLVMKSFPQDGQVNPGDPLPVWAPLPFVQARAVGGTHAASGAFLLDTGAQLSMVSVHLGLAAGLDSNRDGLLDDQDDRYAGSQPITGVGGVVDVPLFDLDALVVGTSEGVDLRWEAALTAVFDESSGGIVLTNVPVTVLVLEIHPEIDGVVGMDLLHSGWTDGALGGTNAGPILAAYGDFSDPAAMTAELVIDLSTTWTSVQDRVDEDIDGDDLPDAWELTYYASTTNASGHTGSDSDGDGFDDAAERIAGTDPSDENSLLRVTGQSQPASGADRVALTWQAVTGLTYHVMSSPGPLPLSGGTTSLTVMGNSSLMSATVTVQDAAGFVRVAVER